MFEVKRYFIGKLTCKTCKYLRKLNKKPMFEKTDDGGRNWKYNYKWTIECEKEGSFEIIVEGGADFCDVPSCSLWRYIKDD